MHFNSLKAALINSSGSPTEATLFASHTRCSDSGCPGARAAPGVRPRASSFTFLALSVGSSLRFAFAALAASVDAIGLFCARSHLFHLYRQSEYCLVFPNRDLDDRRELALLS